MNKDLAKLTDKEAAAGSDTITLNATDSFGNAATPASIAVTTTAAAFVQPPSAPAAFVAAMAAHVGASAGAGFIPANDWTRPPVTLAAAHRCAVA